MLEGKAEENLGFPSFYAKIKKTSASHLFYLFRWGNNASGDNNVVIVMHSTSTCIIIWLGPHGNPARDGYYEYYHVQKRERMQKVKWYAPGNPDGKQQGFCFRCQVQEELFFPH